MYVMKRGKDQKEEHKMEAKEMLKHYNQSTEWRMKELRKDIERYRSNIKQQIEAMDNANGYAALKIAAYELADYAASLKAAMKEYDLLNNQKTEIEKIIEHAE